MTTRYAGRDLHDKAATMPMRSILYSQQQDSVRHPASLQTLLSHRYRNCLSLGGAALGSLGVKASSRALS